MLLINVYHGGQILKTSHGTDYDIQAACTFSADEAINFRDLKRQIHSGLELLPDQFNISISARISLANLILDLCWLYNSMPTITGWSQVGVDSELILN
jgi:hypothetical protein